jgi:hypothetical protein
VGRPAPLFWTLGLLAVLLCSLSVETPRAGAARLAATTPSLDVIYAAARGAYRWG